MSTTATAPYAAGSDTSEAAAHSVEQHVARLESMVLNAIAGSPGGLTCDQIEEETGLSHQCASARVHCLNHKKQLIRDSGVRRPTRSGRGAVVWVANDKAQPRAGTEK